MRAVLTTQGILPLNGGLARSVPLLASALAEQGVQVDLAVPGYGVKASAMLLPPKTVRTHILPQKILRVFPNPWQGRFLFWLWRSSFTRIRRRLLCNWDSALVQENCMWLASNHWGASAAQRMRAPSISCTR